MSDDKKYYWLKLKKDFFRRHDIQIIEAMPNGKDYVLFYLKMLVESVSHNGSLRFNDTIPYDENMLSTITNTNIDIVRTAMKLLTNLKMIEVLKDETIYMAEVEKMMGTETYWAEQKRRTRIGQKVDNVLQNRTISNLSRQELDIDIDIELDKDIDIDIDILRTIFAHWNSKEITIHRELTKTIRGHISAKLKTYTKEEIKTAIDNYSEVLERDDCFLNYRWTLIQFLTRDNGFINFLPENKPLEKYKYFNKEGKNGVIEPDTELSEHEKRWFGR